MPVTHVPVSILDAATYTVLADNSGLTHWLPDLTADITITLPTPAAGLKFRFAYAGAAADAQDWLIVTGSASNYYVGGGIHLLTSAGDTADEVLSYFSDGNSNDNLTVLTPAAGTWVDLECVDGTTWYVNAQVVSATASALAFAD